MKKILLTIAAIALLAAPANAQLISLWADMEMSECSVTNDVMAGTFTFYVFIEPDSRGIFGAEFRLVNPSTGIFVVDVPFANPAADIKVTGGSISEAESPWDSATVMRSRSGSPDLT